MEYVKIVDPKKPGDYRVIAVVDFKPGEHRLWTAPIAGTSASPADEEIDVAPTVPPPSSNVISAYDVPQRRARPRGK